MRGATTIVVTEQADAEDFNPHSPCGERRVSIRFTGTDSNFNPHSPCGERLQQRIQQLKKAQISIHTPHAGSDVETVADSLSDYLFQSTLPMRGATFAAAEETNAKFISIHTPHAGSDCSRLLPSGFCINFNPHSPCGERRYILVQLKTVI